MSFLPRLTKQLNRATSGIQEIVSAPGAAQRRVNSEAASIRRAAERFGSVLKGAQALGGGILSGKSFTGDGLLQSLVAGPLRGPMGDIGMRDERALALKYGPVKLAGGLTMEEARKLFQEFAATDFQRSNLWFVSVEDLNPNGRPDVNLNLFAQSVEYEPVTITSSAHQVGSAAFRAGHATELVEIQISTFDDTAGTLKKWFEARANAMANPDGTFGLPIDYLMRLRIEHAFISQEVAGKVSPFVHEYIVQAAGCSVSLNRGENALAALNITLVEHDSFGNLI